MGALRAQCWACSSAAPKGGRKSLLCCPAGTYVCLEAPAPKLLLLICNPLRAGGKGIRGINGLTVTTTIISSGCLGQAMHTRTGLSPRLTSTHKRTVPCPHTDRSAQADGHLQNRERAGADTGRHTACTPRNLHTRTDTLRGTRVITQAQAEQARVHAHARTHNYTRSNTSMES